MFKRMVCIVSVAAGLVALPLLARGVNLQTGKWEITVQMKGMPMAVPPSKQVQCIRQEDAVPELEKDNKDCKVISKQVKGDTVTWSMNCSNADGKVVSDGEVKYEGTTFHGIIHMTVHNPSSGPMKLTEVVHGKRIGECDE